MSRAFAALPALMLLASWTAAARGQTVASETVSLAGVWMVRLDRQDRGLGPQWMRRGSGDAVRLPGSLQEQGFGDDIAVDTPWVGGIADRSWYTEPRYAAYRTPGNIKVPFWLQPEKHYLGAAWFQRELVIPAHWRGRRVVLSLERPHWETQVWLDETALGTRDSLSTPHRYDLTRAASPGRPQRLTVRVDNRLKVGVGVNAHSVSDHTQTSWCGIVGALQLTATDPVWLDDVQVYPDVANRRARVVATIGDALGGGGEGTLRLAATSFNTDTPHRPAEQSHAIQWTEHEASVELVYPLGEGTQLWDEFHPALYRLDVQLDVRKGQVPYADRRAVVFGMRQIGAQGTQFALNGRKIFLRGTLDCCIFPLTGYPPTDQAPWQRIFRICQAHGLNHMRFHSWCPPEAAFAAADRAGVYLQVECAAWANQGSSLGDGKPIDRWIYQEADAILREYGNHPSLLLMASGNEPAGPGRGAEYLGPWVEHYKTKDPRRVYTGAAGWPVIPENQYHNTPEPRIQAWGAGLRSRINAFPPETTTDYRDVVARYDVPLVSHEMGQWCAYPDLEEIPKYAGLLKAKNFEIFRETLATRHMGDQAGDFLMASGKLQVLCYKEDIESALRTPGLGGFQLLQLHDFPGQGTALVGVLDPFWDDKGYLAPSQFRRFAGQTTPLARLSRRIWTAAETFSADLEIAHFGPQPLGETEVRWTIREAPTGRVAGDGRLIAPQIPIGNGISLGRIQWPCRAAQPPARLNLTVELAGTDFANDWDFWVYPEQLPPHQPNDVLIVSQLDDPARQALRDGGKVLLLPPPALVQTEAVIGFSSIFWNTAWTRQQPPHTLGILCDPRHPSLADFPTESHSNWQWWELIHGSAAMVLNDLPPQLRPLVQPIDTWFENRRLGLLFEAQVDGGKLLVCSMDLSSRLEQRPVARQLRHSLLSYMQSDRFQPQVALQAEQVRSLMRQPGLLEQLGAGISADSQQPGHEASQAIDGDPQTIWHTAWGQDTPKYHELTERPRNLTPQQKTLPALRPPPAS